jgi:hypothetical protein
MPTKKKTLTREEAEAKLAQYRALFEKEEALRAKRKKIEAEVFAACEANPDWFDGRHRAHFGECFVEDKLQSKIVLPEDMRNANDAKFLRFCKSYPRAVKFELLRSQLANLKLGKWGVRIETERVKQVEW